METSFYSLSSNSRYKHCFRSPHVGLCNIFIDSRAVIQVQRINSAKSCNHRLFRALKEHRCQRNPRIFAIESATETEAVGSSTIEMREIEIVEYVTPIYLPTPPNCDLRTPHCG
ncbi:tocopherol cyclase [Sarracenia purpurea var. burkii]